MNNAIHYPRDVAAKVNYYGGTLCTIAVGKEHIWQGGLSGELLRMMLEMIEERQIADIREADAWAVAGSPEPNLPHLRQWRLMHREKLAVPPKPSEQPVLPFCPPDIFEAADPAAAPQPDAEPVKPAKRRRRTTTTKKGK